MSDNQALIDSILRYATEVDTLIRTVKSSDAALFDGKTMAQVIAEYTAAIEAGVSAHSILSNNPHGVTKLQIGLGNVVDYGVATQLEAEAGLVNNKYLTPLRVAQAITALGSVQFLGSGAQAVDAAKLENKTLAEITTQILSGTAANATLFSGQTLAQVLATVDGSIDAKIAAALDALVSGAPGTLDTLNELAAALGDDPNFAATVTAQLAAKETPAGAQAKVDVHATRVDNPHAVTKTQVGLGSVQNLGLATQAQAEGGTINTAYMTPLRVAEAIAALGGTYYLGKSAQALDSAKFEGLTLAQVTAQVLTGNAASATKLQTVRAVSITGDGTATGNFDGTAPLTLALVLANSGAVSGTYTKVTINAKGIVTAGTALLAADIPTLDASKIGSGTLVAARLSGTYAISVSGNAGTATKLATAVAINGVDFDGAGPITVPPKGSSWDNAGRISIVNGSAAQGMNLGSLLVSNAYADVTLVPTNGAYIKGDITTAGNVNCAEVYATGWLRTTGATGWFNSTHGGGMYMTDATWVRTYNGKSLLAGNALRLEGATPQVALYDSDAGIVRSLYHNSGVMGFLTSAGNWAFQCDDAGNVVAAGNVSGYSDVRTKKKIRRIRKAMSKIRTLDGITYVDKASGEERTGLKAQQVQKVLPQAVNVLKDKRGTLTLAYGNLAGLLVEGIRETDEDLQDTKADVKAMQSEINALKALVNELLKK